MAKQKAPLDEKGLRRKLADKTAECKEEHDWRMRLHEEAEDLKKRLSSSEEAMRLRAINLRQERQDLEGRIQRINLHLFALGYQEESRLRSEAGR